MTGLSRGFRTHQPENASRHMVCWLMLLSLAFGSTFGPKIGAAAETVDLVALDRDLADLRARLERVRRDVDRSAFDPDALVDRLDYDAQAILEAIADEIVFQPYEGTLRGVSGTLRAGAGNSLDQSILLAAMLKSAGYDARVARGTLSPDEALRLLRRTAGAIPAADLDYLQPALNEAFPTMGEPEPDIDLGSTQAARDAREQSAALLKALKDAGIDLKPRDVTARWQSLLQEYFWVQYRESSSAGWQDAHPSFGTAAEPPEVTAEEYFADRVPGGHHHTFTLQAWIESDQAGKISQHPLMNPWTVPVANYAGQAIDFRMTPAGLPADSGRSLAETLAQARFFTPVLNGGAPPGAQAFDLRGRVLDPFALNSPAAGLFQTLGDKLASATEGVQQDEDGRPVLALHSIWLEFTHTTPAGVERTQRRYLIPPRSASDADPQQLAWPLITDHVYLLAAGGEPLDLLADRYLHTAVENTDWLKVMVHKLFEPDAPQPVPTGLPAEFPPLVQYWLMDQIPVLQGTQSPAENLIAYRAEPGLLGLRRGYRNADTAFVAVDIVWNGMEHVRTSSDGMERLPEKGVLRGTWDTALESVPSRVQGLDPNRAANTIRVMQLATEQILPIKVFPPGGSADLSQSGLDAAARRFLEADLQSGYAVVLPARVPAGAKMGGWWRVNPETGETLGMTADGYGAEVVEYLVDMTLTVRGLLGALENLEKCQSQPTVDTRLCCLVEANINNVAGLSFGGILGVTTGTAGSAVFELLNSDPDNPIFPSADAGCDRLPATDF